MSKPVIRLSYDKAGKNPLILDECGFIKWPDTPTDEHDFIYYVTNISERIEGIDVGDIKKIMKS